VTALDPATEARLAALDRFGTNASSFLALNAGNEYFTEPGLPGFMAYRSSGRVWVQFGGPVTAPESRADLLGAFVERATAAKARVLGVQLLRADAELQGRLGFHCNQFGSSYSIELASFSLRGQQFVKTRNMISRAKRDGVAAGEVGRDLEAGPELGAELDEVDARWLRDKGRFVKELRFFVGERTGPLQPMRRVFVARTAGRTDAYVTYSPVLGEQPGWLYDLTRRRPDGGRGAIEMVFAMAAERMRDDADKWLHLGLTPFVGLDQAHELDCRHKSAARSIRLLAEHGGHLYPAASQLAFKKKWRPQLETPEYLTFQGRLGLRDVWSLMKVANLL
jgi:lysylphosphatidylglycerol synthetase-like protein (DUF2156 family)